VALSEAREILARFPLLPDYQVEEHRGGHINTAFRVTDPAADTTYLLQRLNPRVFPDGGAVVRNVARVTDHLTRVNRALSPESARFALTLHFTRQGEPGVRAPDGAWWRLYTFIEGARAVERPGTAEEAYQIGCGFGRFHRQMWGYAGPPLELVLPGFHDTPARLKRLHEVVRADPAGRVREAGPELERIHQSRRAAESLTGLLGDGTLPARIAHNDAKASNVLLDARSGEALAVVDLDTVMPGTPLFDVGDLIRSVTCNVAEDHPVPSEVEVRAEFLEALLEGFLGAPGTPHDPPTLTREERGHVLAAGLAITFEQAVRFLTDHLEGDRYYRLERPGQNLARARVQLALLTALERERGRLERIAR
jgi:hypothetical protein